MFGLKIRVCDHLEIIRGRRRQAGRQSKREREATEEIIMAIVFPYVRSFNAVTSWMLEA